MGENSGREGLFDVCLLQMLHNAISGPRKSGAAFHSAFPGIRESSKNNTSQNEIMPCFLANRSSIESFCWCRWLPVQNSFYANVAI